jgi:uncharacterized protein (DUF58 family)
MQVTGLIALAIFVGILMTVVFGAAWFIAVPVAFLFFLIPVAFIAVLAARQRRPGAPSGQAPTSGEASYEPVVDPAQRPQTR